MFDVLSDGCGKCQVDVIVNGVEYVRYILINVGSYVSVWEKFQCRGGGIRFFLGGCGCGQQQNRSPRPPRRFLYCPLPWCLLFPVVLLCYNECIVYFSGILHRSQGTRFCCLGCRRAAAHPLPRPLRVGFPPVPRTGIHLPLTEWVYDTY